MANVRRQLGDENIWIEFKSSGYPYSLQRKIRDERDDRKTLEIILPYVVACHLPVVGDAAALETLSTVDELDNVDEEIVVKIIREFFSFRQERMYAPVAPNS